MPGWGCLPAVSAGCQPSRDRALSPVTPPAPVQAPSRRRRGHALNPVSRETRLEPRERQRPVPEPRGLRAPGWGPWPFVRGRSLRPPQAHLLPRVSAVARPPWLTPAPLTDHSRRRRLAGPAASPRPRRGALHVPPPRRFVIRLTGGLSLGQTPTRERPMVPPVDPKQADSQRFLPQNGFVWEQQGAALRRECKSGEGRGGRRFTEERGCRGAAVNRASFGGHRGLERRGCSLAEGLEGRRRPPFLLQGRRVGRRAQLSEEKTPPVAEGKPPGVCGGVRLQAL